MDDSDDILGSLDPVTLKFISLYFASRLIIVGSRCVRRILDWACISFIDSHCGKFECDASTVDTINFRSDFHGTI